MATRTGHPEIDALLDSFAKARFKVRMDRRQPAKSTLVRELAAAPGMCQVIAEKFETWMAPRLPDGAQAYGSGLYKPDDHGYTDRSVRGFPTHSSSIVELASGERFVIDWSASQYGYDQVPLVQRMGPDGQLERDFDRPELSTDPVPSASPERASSRTRTL